MQSGYNTSSFIPISYNISSIQVTITYSLVPLPNSTPFSCGPASRYKAFSSFPGSVLVPINNQSYSLSFFLSEIDGFQLSDPPAFVKSYNNIFLNLNTNYSIILSNQINFSNYLPNDCTRIGDFPVVIPYNRTIDSIATNLTYFGSSLTCSVKSIECGYQLYSTFPSIDCCTVNNTFYNTLPSCYLSTNLYTLDNCTCSKNADTFHLIDWIIGTSIATPILFLIIIGLVIYICCCSAGRFIRA